MNVQRRSGAPMPARGLATSGVPGSWAYTNMTGNSGVLPPAPGSALAGYWQASDDSRHAHFIGQDGNLYELLFTAAQGQWAYTNMTGNSGVLPPAPGSALARYRR
jgi:hypothetical protein